MEFWQLLIIGLLFITPFVLIEIYKRMLMRLPLRKRKIVSISVVVGLVLIPCLAAIIVSVQIPQGDEYTVAAVLNDAYIWHNSDNTDDFKCSLIDIQTSEDDPYAKRDFHFSFRESVEETDGIFGNKKSFIYYDLALAEYKYKKGTILDSIKAAQDPSYDSYLKSKGKDVLAKQEPPVMPSVMIHGKKANIGDICCVVVRNYKSLSGKMYRSQLDVFVPDTIPVYNEEYMKQRAK